MKSGFQKAIEQRLRGEGIRMRKLTRPPVYGLLFSSDPLYDYKTANSGKELAVLIEDGYVADVDLGAWLFNALWHYTPAKPPKKRKES